MTHTTFLSRDDTAHALRAIGQEYKREVELIASNPKTRPDGTVLGDAFSFYDLGRAIGLLRAMSIIVTGTPDTGTQTLAQFKSDLATQRAEYAAQRAATR